MKQTSFIRTLLGTSAIVAFGLSTPAFAQDSSTDDSVDDEVVVTGSRIKRDNFSRPVSMDVLNTEDAKIEGNRRSGRIASNSHGCFRFITNHQCGFNRLCFQWRCRC